MAKFRYIGDPADRGAGPQTIEMYGYMFGRKEFTEVPETPANVEAIRRLSNHFHFESDKAKRAPDDHGAAASAVPLVAPRAPAPHGQHVAASTNMAPGVNTPEAIAAAREEAARQQRLKDRK